ncbi:hypothetical protein BDN72DRAFT_839029 [Pluteus cervinus]|uniref:Uncharacterized protein n=1 Tax=Pluteus cervinus TaxID=181527 RepID=A0ACD3AZH5_9AGAR|nr:hypothetical protein BDN72DRAFT_839029 [Pluteus cervinus]
MSMMFTATASFERDYDLGAGTGVTCALASFVMTVIDVEEKGYNGVLALAGVHIGVVHCDEDWRLGG